MANEHGLLPTGQTTNGVEIIHNPRGFDAASSGTQLAKSEKGVLIYDPLLQLQPALNFVSCEAAPPTEVAADVYVLNQGTQLDVDIIAWQSGDTVRVTFTGSPDLSGFAANDYFRTSGNTNSSNDGNFLITAVDNSTKYFEITNAARTDATDDESTGAPGIGYGSLGEWDGASFNDWVRFDGSVWYRITPVAGSFCYDATAALLKTFGTTWSTGVESVTIGDSISGGTATQILYLDGSGNLADSASMTFDGTDIDLGPIAITTTGSTPTNIDCTSSVQNMKFSVGANLLLAIGNTSGNGQIDLYQSGAIKGRISVNSADVSYLNGGGGFLVGGSTKDASAIMQVDSTTQGFAPPRMTTTQRNAISPAMAGIMIYNTTTNKLNFYNGSAWEAVTSA